MGWCVPVGEHLWGKSHLTTAAPAGQSRTRVPPRKGPYEAGCSEQAGRVMAPRNGESCGAAAGVHALAGSRPGCARARAPDTPGVCERGMAAQGARGNVGEPPVSWTTGPEWGPG